MLENHSYPTICDSPQGFLLYSKNIPLPLQKTHMFIYQTTLQNACSYTLLQNCPNWIWRDIVTLSISGKIHYGQVNLGIVPPSVLKRQEHAPNDLQFYLLHRAQIFLSLCPFYISFTRLKPQWLYRSFSLPTIECWWLCRDFSLSVTLITVIEHKIVSPPCYYDIKIINATSLFLGKDSHNRQKLWNIQFYCQWTQFLMLVNVHQVFRIYSSALLRYHMLAWLLIVM